MEDVEDEQCQICNDKIGRFYLKVAACRACTVFYRRSIQMGRQYKCQLGYKSCNLKTKTKGKPLCRYCRLEKCKELGMKLERVRRKTKSEIPTSPSIPHSTSSITTESVIKSPIQDSPCSSTSRIIEKKQFNMQPIEQKVKEILAQPASSLSLAPGIRLTFLQQLCLNFPVFYEEIKPKPPIIMVNQFDRMTSLKFQERFWIGLANLLIKCEQFAELGFEDKWLLYKHAWLIFFKIERYYSTIQTFGTSFNDFRIMYNDTLVLDFNNPDNTIKDVYPQHYEQWKSLWYPIRDKYFKCIVNPMKSLQISRFELIYVLAQILWSATDITGLSEKANRVAEDISDQISNELHDHYVHERHLTNYASRLTKLNKIISATEAVLHAKKDFSVIVKIFNLWDFEVVGSELCD